MGFFLSRACVRDPSCPLVAWPINRGQVVRIFIWSSMCSDAEASDEFLINCQMSSLDIK